MIHNNSNDPVYIKKIRLQVWYLRDEVEAVVKARVENNEGEQLPDFSDLVEEYKVKQAKIDAPGLSVIEGGADDGAAEMAAAMEEAAEGEGEEASEESSEETPEGEEAAEEQSAEASSEDAGEEASSEKVTITQRRPSIPDDKLLFGTTVLAEVGMDRMFFFCNKKFLEGQSIVIEFLVPKKFIVNADVMYCRPYNMKSRIISDRKLPYRIAVDFTFLRQGERTLLRNFLQSVEPEIVEAAPKPQKASGGGGGDDFDDLDDLDL